MRETVVCSVCDAESYLDPTDDWCCFDCGEWHRVDPTPMYLDPWSHSHYTGRYS